MEAKVNKTSDSERELVIKVSEENLKSVMRQVYNRLRPQVKVAGFRPGKAPDNIIEKELGVQKVQQEVLEEALNQYYAKVVQKEDLRPIEQPRVEIKKYVPYTELEFSAKIEVMPEVKLPDYKKISKKTEKVEVTQKEIDAVIKTIQERLADKKEVKRAAKNGDEVAIDFTGKKDGKEIPNASSKNYTLKLGSNKFIPGFEENIVGMKPEETKTFEIKFPKEYGEKSLANQKVQFEVTLHKVLELNEPKVDDELAKKAGPFSNVDDLKESISQSIKSEKQRNNSIKLENEIVDEVVKKSKVALPDSLIEKQKDQLIAQLQQDLSYRGQTLEQYLKDEGKSKPDLEKELKPEAEKRIKTALVLTAVSEQEKLEVTPEELEVRKQLIKGQYNDKKMQEEVEKPEAARQIANQLLTEKTVQSLVDYTTKE